MSGSAAPAKRLDPGGAGGQRGEHYGRLSIALHWLMLLLIVAVYVCIELREAFPKGSEPREALKTWHYMLGLSVFALVWVRLVLHFLGPIPGIEPPPPRWQVLASAVVHFLLYVFMIAMPLLGWLVLSAEGKPVPLFGFELPPLAGENESLAHWAEEVHEAFGKVGYFLIGLHAAAALFHHYVLRDNTLRRMLP
ncbi:MAG TPA: cytochrome b [Burkholderiales bacterium]|jgi:cytochrome b561|nr:cytochrome b [Burkholderiales bacterium]